jgi:hypothetical protein
MDARYIVAVALYGYIQMVGLFATPLGNWSTPVIRKEAGFDM